MPKDIETEKATADSPAAHGSGHQTTNPIFVEYYSHEQSDCYKILVPWSHYKETKIVLCPVREGIEVAKALAKHIIAKHLAESLEEPIGQNDKIQP
jgi:hypothetical protein